MTDINKPVEYHDIILTDIQLHTAKARKPIPWYKAIWRSIKNRTAGRFYSRDIQVKKGGTILMGFPLPPNIQKEKEIAEKSGKQFRLFMPKDGLPLALGPDAIEALKAKERKANKTRVWRSN